MVTCWWLPDRDGTHTVWLPPSGSAASPYAWAACPMGCGVTGGELHHLDSCGPEPGHTPCFVKLWQHVFATRPALGICIASRQHAPPLPLAAPAELDRQEQIAAVAALGDAAQFTLFSPDDCGRP
jgi:hypothetical protein